PGTAAVTDGAALRQHVWRPHPARHDVLPHGAGRPLGLGAVGQRRRGSPRQRRRRDDRRVQHRPHLSAEDPGGVPPGVHLRAVDDGVHRGGGRGARGSPPLAHHTYTGGVRATFTDSGGDGGTRGSGIGVRGRGKRRVDRAVRGHRRGPGDGDRDGAVRARAGQSGRGGGGGHGAAAGRGRAHPDRNDHRSGADRVACDLHAGHRHHPVVRAADQVGDPGIGALRACARDAPPLTKMARRLSSRLPRIPEMTIRRLSVYTRCLLQLEEDGVKTVSSQELADRFNLNSAQVRKDLAYFGEFGVRGIGYYVSGLKAELQKILGLDREWTVVLVGFGNLGSALSRYKGFARQGFRIVAVVDDDPAKVGREIDHMPVIASRDMAREIKARGAQIAIVAVPAESAQTVTDQLVAAGIKAILNFAPARLKVPRDVRLKNVDLSIELETLSFYLAKGSRS